MVALTLAEHEAQMPDCDDPDCEFHHPLPLTPIEAAAKAAYNSWSISSGYGLGLPWEDLHEESKYLWLKLARDAHKAYTEVEEKLT